VNQRFLTTHKPLLASDGAVEPKALRFSPDTPRSQARRTLAAYRSSKAHASHESRSGQGTARSICFINTHTHAPHRENRVCSIPNLHARPPSLSTNHAGANRGHALDEVWTQQLKVLAAGLKRYLATVHAGRDRPQLSHNSALSEAMHLRLSSHAYECSSKHTAGGPTVHRGRPPVCSHICSAVCAASSIALKAASGQPQKGAR
jgi:hypothetical protein